MKPLAPLAACVVLLAGCARHDPAPAPAAALPAAKVHVATLRLEPLPALVEVTGTVRAVQRAVIAAKVMGTIDDLPVTLGQPVRRGEVLARISAAEINARVTQAQSQLNAARRDLERERSLLPKGASTAEMVRGLEDRFAAAEAMVREAEVMLGYATVKAPFDGVVARKFAQAGDLASPGHPLLEVEGRDALEVEAGIPDSLTPLLTMGAEVAAEIPAAGVTLPATLKELAPAADAQVRSITAKFSLPGHAALRSGQFVRLRVPGASLPMLLAPAAAVSVAGQMERVFIVGRDNRSVLRLVKTGARHGEQVEILAGLDAGERVVLGNNALVEGQPLEIQP